MSPTCSNMPIELIASYGPSCDVAVVGVTDLDEIADAELGRRLRARSACGFDSVTPTARTPCSLAACSTIPPHPHPMSSSRIPGSSPSFRDTSSCLLACACSSVVVVVGPDGARVRERRPEHDAVEVVGDVVVVRDRRRIARLGVPAAAEARLLGRWRQGPERLDPEQLQRLHDLRGAHLHVLELVLHRDHVEHVALDREITGDVGTPEPELVGRGDDAPQRVLRSHHGGRASSGGRSDCRRTRRTRPASRTRARRTADPATLTAKQCCRTRRRPRGLLGADEHGDQGEVAGGRGDGHHVPHLVISEHQRVRIRPLEPEPDGPEGVQHTAGEEQEQLGWLQRLHDGGSASTTIQPMPM